MKCPTGLAENWTFDSCTELEVSDSETMDRVVDITCLLVYHDVGVLPMLKVLEATQQADPCDPDLFEPN